MLFAKRVELRAFQIEDTDDFALVLHGEREFRARFRIHHQIARIDRNIRNEHRLAQGCGGADDAFASGHAKFSLRALAMLYVETMAKDFLLFVVEHDAENLIVDDAFDLLGGAAQKLFDIKNGAHFAADFVEQEQRVGLRIGALIEARIFNGDRQAAAQQGQNALLIGSEIVQPIALDIQNANAFAMNHQRDSQFGAHAVNRIDVARIVGNIAYADGVAGCGSGSGNSLSDWNTEIFRQIAWIAYGKAMLQNAFFNQKDAEDFVVNVLLDERSGAGKNFVEIQGSVDLLTDFGKCGEDFR